MTPEELDEATVEEARRRWLSTPALRIHGTLGEDAPFIAARLAREGWAPPKPVDPDLLAFREFASKAARSASLAESYRDGDMDSCASAYLFLAGARMAREQEQERAKVLDWMTDQTSLELAWRADPEEDGVWCVHRVTGGVNDREWRLVAVGQTPLSALMNARAIYDLAKYRGEA